MDRLLSWLNMLIKKRREFRRWQRIVTFMAAIITFATTYALILPAITVERDNTENVGGMYLKQEEAQEDLLEENALEFTGVSIAADQENAVTYEYADDNMTATAVFSTNEEIPEGTELVVNPVDTESEEYAELSGRAAVLLDKEFIYDVTTCSFYKFALIRDGVDVTPKTGLVDVQINFINNTVEHVDDSVYAGRFGRPADVTEGFVAMSADYTDETADVQADTAVAADGGLTESVDLSNVDDELVYSNPDESSTIELSDSIITVLSLKGSDLALTDNVVGILAGNVDEEAKAAAAETDAEIPDDVSQEDSPANSAQGEGEAAPAVKTLKANGDDYTVVLTYDESSKIPEGAYLTASEISQDSKEYKTYLEETKKAMGLTEEETLPRFAARFFDIKIMVGDDEFTPNSGVSVEITYAEPLAEEADAEVSAVHFEDETAKAEVIEANTTEVQSYGAAAVEFTAESFSVYGVIYTVDFEYSVNCKMYQFSLPGGGFVSFTDLVEVLGIIGDTNAGENEDENGSVITENAEENAVEIVGTVDENATNEEAEENGVHSDTNTSLTLGDVVVSDASKKFVADVASVEFSNPELVDVSKVDADTTVGQIKESRGLEVEYSAELTEEQIAEINAKEVKAGDWALISMQSFTSEESLTVTMKNGDRFVIKVTDAVVPSLNQIDTNKEYVLYSEKNGHIYALKTDGTTVEVVNRADLDTMDNNYKWQFTYVYTDSNGVSYYNIRPVDNRYQALALNWPDQNLVQNGSSNVKIIPFPDGQGGYYFEGYNGVNMANDASTGWFHGAWYAWDNNIISRMFIYEQEQIRKYDFTVASADFAMGSVAGRDKNGSSISNAAEFDSKTKDSKKNNGKIVATPQSSKYLFDYWDLNGEQLSYGNTIPDNDLTIPYQGSTLTAHFKRNPDWVAPDEEKEGRPINKQELEDWLNELKNRQIPLNDEACKKTAELYDYENRIYRVDMTAQSNLSSFEGDIDLGFMIDVSASMQFPSKLEKVNGKYLQLNYINDNSTNQAWLDQSKEYYIIADKTGTATSMRLKWGEWLCKNPDQTHSNNYRYWGWGVSDASVSGDGAMRLITQTRPFMTDDLGEYYQIYTAGDNGKKRKDYLEASLADVADEVSEILDILSIASETNENPDVKAAWNTFAADVYRGAGQTSHDFVSMNEGMNITYDYKGGTSTDLAILDAAGLQRSNPMDHVWVNHTYSEADGFHWGDNSKRYAILITDGAPQRANFEIDNYVKEAAELLKNGEDGIAGTDDDVTLITVGLSMGDVKRGSILLYDIANKDSNGDPYFYKAETGDELQYVLYEIIKQIVGKAIVEGTVTDTVNEAFYPVDKTSGKPLENGDKIDLDGNLITGTPSGPYGEITVSDGTYSVEWKNQDFTWDGWHGTFYQKAKEDFLGGNAVRTNSGNAVIQANGYKMQAGDPMIEFNQETKNKGHKELETPRVNVNELNLMENNTEWTVYLGTEVNPREQLEELYNNILVEEVIDKGIDTNGNQLPDRAVYEGNNNHYRFSIEESMSDQRAAAETKVTFKLKEVVPLTDDQWDQIIEQSQNEGDNNKGLTIPYDAYGQDCPGSVTIKLVKNHDPAAHRTSETGTPVETYTLTAVFSPDYDHVPVGQGGKPELAKEYHTGTFGLGYPGHATGMDTSTNTHEINVYAKKLTINKVDQADQLIRNLPATFKMFRKAVNGDAAGDYVSDVPDCLPDGNYILVETLTTSNGTFTTTKDIDSNYEYYLVETKAPDGYYGLPGYFNVSVDLKDLYTKTLDPTQTSETKWNPWELSNWEQSSKLIVDGSDETMQPYVEYGTDGDGIGYNYDSSSTPVTYRIRNDAGARLPNTGGSGTSMLYLLGITLIGLAGAGLVMRKRRRDAA